MGWDKGPVRLSLYPLVGSPGGQGQPYGDDVVARARELVEGTWLTQKEIGARIGVSRMSVCRWARAGGWRRPSGAARPFDETGASLRAMQRYVARTRPWSLLAEAEALLAALARDGADLDRLERALALVLEARELHARGIGPTRGRGLVRASKRPAAPTSSA